ncbi:integrase catalytic domain-containing protein [Trichonephila inaurata madagascariensis]|uniref:Integrase catalytic domain-containing protein n=1 Tax=Trichonephila inaurata madagascariensis TaxID=2747483 RepID=A0A8X6YF32_9ARAC|nr:integrase catalytic domain-containing protein [Trichonephila inaurata madagascariensis]
MEGIRVDSEEDMLIEDIAVSDTCYVCLKETSDTLACQRGHEKIHTFCGPASKDNEMDILCTLSYKIENAIEGKINSKIDLEIQAKKNETEFGKKIPTAYFGTIVRVSIPDADKGQSDSRNILAGRMSVTEDGFNRLETLLKEF